MNKEFLPCLKSLDKGPNVKKGQHLGIDALITSNTVYVAMVKIVLMLLCHFEVKVEARMWSKNYFC